MIGFAFKLDAKAWLLTEAGEYKELQPDYAKELSESEATVVSIDSTAPLAISKFGRMLMPNPVDTLEKIRQTGGLPALVKQIGKPSGHLPELDKLIDELEQAVASMPTLPNLPALNEAVELRALKNKVELWQFISTALAAFLAIAIGFALWG